MVKVCTFLVGAPGAGKSTWMKNQEWLDDTYVASTDDIIEVIASDYGLTYDEAFKDLVGFAEKVMWRELKVAAESGDLIYIDRTNMSRKSRRKFIDFLAKHGYTFNAVVFDVPEDRSEWNRRLNSRPGKTIPENVIQSMIASFQFPTHGEGFREITVVNAFATEDELVEGN
jgi:predicted kinase